MFKKDFIRIINEEISEFDFLNNQQYQKDREYVDLLNNEDLQKQFDVYKAKMESLLISQLELIKDIKGINGRPLLIVDDICSKGGTFLAIADVLKKKFPKSNRYLAVSHFEGTANKEIYNSFSKVYYAHYIGKPGEEKGAFQIKKREKV